MKLTVSLSQCHINIVAKSHGCVVSKAVRPQSLRLQLVEVNQDRAGDQKALQLVPAPDPTVGSIA